MADGIGLSLAAMHAVFPNVLNTIISDLVEKQTSCRRAAASPAGGISMNVYDADPKTYHSARLGQALGAPPSAHPGGQP